MSNDIENKPLAYCDKLIIGQGGYCGAGSSGGCDPNLWIWGHCDDGSDVAFRILLRDEDGNVVSDSLRSSVMDGYYRWVSGLVSQRADGILTTSKRNPGPPWNACDFLIPTRGAGGYSLSQYLGVPSLHRYPEVTWIVQVLASPVKWETTPDGQFLHRWSLGEWNWEAMLEAKLHIYYKNRCYLCDEVTVGALPYYQSPIISSVSYKVADDEGERGYANVIVSFKTDIKAQGRVYYAISQSTEEIPQPCNPLEGWHSATTEADTEHIVALDQSALWYSREVPKTYCFQVLAWPERYRYVHEARGYSKQGAFTLPSPS